MRSLKNYTRSCLLGLFLGDELVGVIDVFLASVGSAKIIIRVAWKFRNCTK
jgi:hypothetical protein